MNAMTDFTAQSPNAAWTDVGAVTDIPLRGARRVPTPEGDIAVFRTGDGKVFALRDQCPHKGGPLSQGIVFGDHVACPLHNWAISLVDGSARAPDIGCATAFRVRVEAGVVSLSAGELRERATGEHVDAGDDFCEAKHVIAIACAR